MKPKKGLITPESLIADGWEFDPKLSKNERRGRSVKLKRAYRKGYWIVMIYEMGKEGELLKHFKVSSSLYLGLSSRAETTTELTKNHEKTSE